MYYVFILFRKPVSEKIFQFGHKKGKGLAIGSLEPPKPTTVAPTCPDTLEVRQLVRHPEISNGKKISAETKIKFFYLYFYVFKKHLAFLTFIFLTPFTFDFLIHKCHWQKSSKLKVMKFQRLFVCTEISLSARQTFLIVICLQFTAKISFVTWLCLFCKFF